MKSVMKHDFSQVPRADIPRSSFNRSHGFKTTFNAGYLVPILVDEALPGDTFSLRGNFFARMSTPIVPVMDNLFFDTFYFCVPMRLVWDNWQRFNGEQIDPGDSTDYTIPQIVSPVGGYAVGSLYDYMGLPTGVAGMSHSALFLRAYNLIYNEWFRDQNLQDSVDVPRDDGPDTYSDYVLLRRGKRHDYFTSCLPWPQKGPSVVVPLGDTAPIIGTGDTIFFSSDNSSSLAETRLVCGPSGGASFTNYNGSNHVIAFKENTEVPAYADLSEATASTINQLRQSFQIQKMLERDARGGTRYVEIILAHFGVRSPDARLQRPEYLGGDSTPISIHPVAQTSSTDSESPQANLAAFGTMSKTGDGFTKSFTEHCIVIGLAAVRADLNYQQGLNRMWSRETRYDFYWPALSHIGEQAVLSKEIYCDGTSDDENVFGYQERYAEYRYKPSQITGKFRSTAAGTLDIWHLAQKFTTRPTLSSTFIQDNPPVDRVVAVNTEPQFLLDAFFQYRCARPMPVYSVPGLVDHF